MSCFNIASSAPSTHKNCTKWLLDDELAQRRDFDMYFFPYYWDAIWSRGYIQCGTIHDLIIVKSGKEAAYISY